MVITTKKYFGLFQRKMVWFSDKIDGKFSSLTIYKQATNGVDLKGYIKTPFYTKLIDLTKTIEEINADIDKNTIYEVRRATKDGSQFRVCSSSGEFLAFYNAFARDKKLKQISKDNISPEENIVITEAIVDNVTKVMHAYLVDSAIHRTRLLYSASQHLSSTSTSERAIIGRMNRYLHLQDMLYFKELNYKVYDMGGYAFETKDEALLNINKFKDGFGGSLVCEYDYWPWYYKYILNV